MESPDFQEQVEAMVQASSESLKNTWEAWQGVFGTVAGTQDSAPGAEESDRAGEAGSPAAEDGEIPFPGAAAAAALNGMADSMLAGYDVMLRMVQSTVGAANPWSENKQSQRTGEQSKTGAEALRLLHEQMMLFPPFAAAQHMLSLLGLSSEEVHRLQLQSIRQLFGPWSKHWDASQDLFAEEHKSALDKFSNLYWDALERMAGPAAMPGGRYAREFQEHWTKSSRAWLEFQSASLDYLVLLGQAWRKALTELNTKLVSMAGNGKSVNGLRELLGLWSDVADRVMIRTFGSERFARAQGRLLNAAMAYRLEERQMADSILKKSHMPTRSEMDELGKEVMDLRRQLRAILKQQQQSSSQAEPTRPQPTNGQSEQ